LRPADVFVDIFDDIIRQILAGADPVAITNPSQVALTENDRAIITTARTQLANAVKTLFDSVIDERRKTTVADELRAVSADAVDYVKAWLKGKSVANEKIEAETMLIIEQARDLYERRQADLAEKALDRERKSLNNAQKRIAIAKKMLDLYRALEPNALVSLATGFGTVASPQPTWRASLK
jgi:peptide subunit release factor 1 (eRF1)